MDIFIELTATIMQNFLIILWFISGYCRYKYNGIKRYISFGIILLCKDCVFVSIINNLYHMMAFCLLYPILLCIYCHICLKKIGISYIYILFCYGHVIFTLSSVISFLISNPTDNPISELYDSISLWRIIILIIYRLSKFAVFKFIC